MLFSSDYYLSLTQLMAQLMGQLMALVMIQSTSCVSVANVSKGLMLKNLLSLSPQHTFCTLPNHCILCQKSPTLLIFLTYLKIVGSLLNANCDARQTFTRMIIFQLFSNNNADVCLPICVGVSETLIERWHPSSAYL